MKKLSIYLPTLASGGAEKLHVTLAPAFIEAGYDLTFVLNRITGVYVDQLPKGVKLYELGADRITSCFWPMVNYLKHEKPDILLSNLGHNNILAIAAGLYARTSTKIIASHHGVLSIECKTTDKWQYKVLPFLSRRLLRYAAANVTVSSGAADDLAEFTGLNRNSIRVIYNPVNLENFEQRSNEPIEHEWLTNKAFPVLISVGRLSEHKNFSLLLSAFKIVLESMKARLIILGEGQLLNDLQNQAISLNISEYVNFVGFKPNPLPYMKNSDVMVLSSIFEGFGNVLIEALACGTPIVSTDCPYGPSEILDNGKYGTLVALNDPEEMADAIIKTLKTPQPKDVLIKRGREFSVTQTVNKYLDLFAELFQTTCNKPD